MRHRLLIVCFFFCLLAKGQNVKKNAVYEFISNEIKDFSPQKIKNLNESVDKQRVERGLKIEVLNINNDIVTYRYLPFKNDTSRASKDFGQHKEFTMAKADFERLTTELESRFKGIDVGFYTIPFRLRGVGSSDFDFESSLSLQSNLVFKFGGRRPASLSQWEGSVGIGLTSVNLNSNNSSVTESRTASAFTLSTGILWKPTDFANFGIFIGWDNLSADDRKSNWKYNKKAWLGLGININFSRIKNNTPPNKKIENP